MPNKAHKILLSLGIVLILILIIFAWFFVSKEQVFEVNFLDVGQGDSILIKTEAGQNILIDGGPDSSVIKRISENLAWWDRTIDLMILTHPHSDHVSGLVEVLNRYKVKRVLYTGVVHTTPDYFEWLQIIKDKNIPLKIINRPQRINLGEESFMEIIYPFESFAGKKVDNLNNSSIVVKLIHGKNKFLLAGDIEEEVEKELIKKNIDLKADVFKANHHGSDISNTEEFINLVNPEIIAITVGADNQFGHPNARTLKRFEKPGVKIYRTDINKTIQLKSDADSIDI